MMWISSYKKCRMSLDFYKFNNLYNKVEQYRLNYFELDIVLFLFMYPFYLELELLKPVIDFLKKQGYVVKREIKIGYCIADIVGFKDDTVIAVELKLSNWKKAIIQAKNYQLGSDFVYLAFPLEKSYNILRKAESKLKKEGIGLLVVNEKNCIVSEIIKPRESNRLFGKIMLNEQKSYKKDFQNKF